MFNSYIFLDYKNQRYCLSTLAGEGDKKDPNSPDLSIHDVRTGLSGKQYFTFIDGQIINIYTGLPISIRDSPTDQTKTWRLTQDGQIRTRDNYCISALFKENTTLLPEIILAKPQLNGKDPNQKNTLFQKWKIVTRHFVDPSTE